MSYETHEVLIWGKTTPELSLKHYETVCTGGVLEDGRFVRLYPIPFRFLEKQFKKYQKIRVRMKKSTKDHRPESYTVDPASIEVLDERYDTDSIGLIMRSQYMFRDPLYTVPTVEELLTRERATGQSIGIVKVRQIKRVYSKARSDEDTAKFDRKLSELQHRKQQQSLFEEEADLEILKSTNYRSHTMHAHWYCNNPSCNGHKMSILDWELSALIRRAGVDDAVEHATKVFNKEIDHLHFILGNIKDHPTSFVVGGLWRWPILRQSGLGL